MGRTIPSFRIAAEMEEKTWKEYRKFLNINDRKIFDNLFTVATLYNSTSSYSAIPIRIYPIMMSIVFHHFKEKNNNILVLNNNLQLDNFCSIVIQNELKKLKT
jgi:hypothetical protein